MLKVIVCLVGVFVILAAGEYIKKKKLLKTEDARKFVHILTGSFVATWPWIISWGTIQLIGLAMIAVVLANRYVKVFSFNAGIKRPTFGDIFFGLAITAAASLTTSNVFFALAILHVALADGFAAVVGTHYGKHWKYRVLGANKTVLGTMTFWFISVCILGAGLLLAHNQITYDNYWLLLLLLPPALTFLENVGVMGVDNILLPIFVILVLNYVSNH